MQPWKSNSVSWTGSLSHACRTESRALHRYRLHSIKHESVAADVVSKCRPGLSPKEKIEPLKLMDYSTITSSKPVVAPAISAFIPVTNQRISSCSAFISGIYSEITKSVLVEPPPPLTASQYSVGVSVTQDSTEYTIFFHSLPLSTSLARPKTTVALFRALDVTLPTRKTLYLFGSS